MPDEFVTLPNGHQVGKDELALVRTWVDLTADMMQHDPQHDEVRRAVEALARTANSRYGNEEYESFGIDQLDGHLAMFDEPVRTAFALTTGHLMMAAHDGPLTTVTYLHTAIDSMEEKGNV